MVVDPPSDIVLHRSAPSASPIEFAHYPPGYGPSTAARRAANAEAARLRRADIHYERRGNRMTRGVMVPYGETLMEIEDLDDGYHNEL